MTNDQNIVRGRHLDSLAADAKRFTLEQNLALNQAIQAELADAGISGNTVLDTVPATVDGWFWLDVSGTPPVPKFYYDGTTYMFDGILPSAEFTVTPSSITTAAFNSLQVNETLSFTFSYRGEPRIPTLSGKIVKIGKPGYEVYDYTVTATALTFTKYQEVLLPAGPESFTLTFTLPATSEYPAATATLTYQNFSESNFVDI